ncbi:hypothetical protein M758_8G190000 [Ceratodon purpureus]|uniref:Uncharacterized protein n=1 Tax=Ceratodon purpureus TaxID=3225 RepID=A0A8T0H5Q6_CERPU|nr:hypothetical protein KC19_8G195000 [Ceratodon purpureus]KAG0609509.1 hypothetical protein M758_8G190000 [Ceratodon purpureus]
MSICCGAPPISCRACTTGFSLNAWGSWKISWTPCCTSSCRWAWDKSAANVSAAGVRNATTASSAWMWPRKTTKMTAFIPAPQRKYRRWPLTRFTEGSVVRIACKIIFCVCRVTSNCRRLNAAPKRKLGQNNMHTELRKNPVAADPFLR